MGWGEIGWKFINNPSELAGEMGELRISLWLNILQGRPRIHSRTRHRWSIHTRKAFLAVAEAAAQPWHYFCDRTQVLTASRHIHMDARRTYHSPARKDKPCSCVSANDQPQSSSHSPVFCTVRAVTPHSLSGARCAASAGCKSCCRPTRLAEGVVTTSSRRRRPMPMSPWPSC